MDRRKFLTYVGCTCCSLALNSCATAPITDRKQLKLIPEAKLNAQAAQIFEKIKKKEKLITGPKLNQIKEIGKRMENSIGEYFYQSKLDDPTIGFDWEYILIDKKNIRNAFCMPGGKIAGKIAVFSGILEVTKNTDGLAAVMGHEIAHAVAKHSVERASRGVVLNVGTNVIDILSGGKLSQVNRTTGMNTIGMVSGMIFASLSGYDIRETPKIWERMKKFSKGKKQSEFLSTHPSPDNRIKKINEWTNSIILDYPPIKI